MHRVNRLAVTAFAFGVAIATAGCSKPSDPAAVASARPTATVAIAPPPTVAPLPTSDDARVTYSKNGVDASMGAGTFADLEATGLPIYPAIKPADMYVIENVTKHTSAITIQGPVRAAIDTVIAWYAARLGPTFKASHMHVMGSAVASFSRVTPAAREAVFVQMARDAASGTDATLVTLTVKKRR